MAALLPKHLAGQLIEAGLPAGRPVHLKLLKRERLCMLFVADAEGRFRETRQWPILAVSGALGPKSAEGDRQAPEGFYRIGPRQLNPNSRFHLGINLGYPNALERQRGWTGSALMIHGGAQSVGCFALGDPAIELVYGMVAAALDAGQGEIAVHALPFRFTGAETGLTPFWQQLQRGEALFAATGRPPRTGALAGNYVFETELENPACAPIVAWP